MKSRIVLACGVLIGMTLIAFGATPEVAPVSPMPSFDQDASTVIAAMTREAAKRGVHGAAVFARAHGNPIDSWQSQMAVVGHFFTPPNDKDKGANVLGIAYAKASEMAATLLDSGAAKRPPVTGEFGWKGGTIRVVGDTIYIAAFSGGPSDDDYAISCAGLDAVLGVNRAPEKH
ncbi:MAG TPA: hypothetical protein VHD32_03500 [Candidatus Didemnitutus sp.]|nr:hypothetical protein [Candidatus Didemnitutus sp.]